MFKVMGNKGFHITFPNGVTLSTQIGIFNYCDNYDKECVVPYKDTITLLEEEQKNGTQSGTAEIAIWYKDDVWITEKCPFCSSDNTVEGYVGIEKWLNIFDWCKNYIA